MTTVGISGTSWTTPSSAWDKGAPFGSISGLSEVKIPSPRWWDQIKASLGVEVDKPIPVDVTIKRADTYQGERYPGGTKFRFLDQDTVVIRRPDGTRVTVFGPIQIVGWARAPKQAKFSGSQFIVLNNIAVAALHCLRDSNPTGIPARHAVMHMTQWAEGVLAYRQDFLTRSVLDIVPGAEFLVVNYGLWETYRRNYNALEATGMLQNCRGMMPPPASVEPTVDRAIVERAHETIEAIEGPEMAPLINALKKALSPLNTLMWVGITAVGLGLFFKFAGTSVGEAAGAYQKSRRR